MGSGTVEIITGRERQRRWSVADKLRILKDALQFGSVGLNDVVTHPPKVPLGGWGRPRDRGGDLQAGSAA